MNRSKESLLRSRHQDARRSDTDAASPTLAQRVSQMRHDLRNPLSGILGFSEMLIEEANELGYQQLVPALERMRQSASDMLRIINEHLDVESLQANPDQLQELQETIGSFAPKIRTAAESLAKECERLQTGTFSDDLLKIAGSADQMLHVVAFSLPGLLAEERDPPADRGTDIRPGPRELISGSPSEIPDAERAISILIPATASVEKIADAGSVLIVDDNESNRTLLSRILRRQGYNATIAKGGWEALALLHDRQFDVVLLDIVMPEIDGHQVLMQMKDKERLRHIPVIMISALDDLDSLVRCIQGGADDYLTKPFSPVLLKARIGACLEKKRLRDQEQGLLKQLQAEQDRSERLLLNILPKPIADRLKQGETTIVDSFPEMSVLFADLVSFTSLFEQMSPTEVVNMLNEIFSGFDMLVQKQGLEKIKTIGDAYMVVGGLPLPLDNHAEAIAELAINMRLEMKKFNAAYNTAIRIRVGIDTGPCVAGIIGRNKFIYDLWGDSVNTASRMESHGQPDSIQVTEATHERLRHKYQFQNRGVIDIKGKGPMPVYLLTGRKNAPA